VTSTAAETSGASRAPTRCELPMLLVDLPSARIPDHVQIQIEDIGECWLAGCRLVPELGGLEPDGHLGPNSRCFAGDLDVPVSYTHLTLPTKA